MEEYDGSAVVQFFRLFNMLTVARCSETRRFRHLTNQIFGSLLFREYLTDKGRVFCSNCSTYDVDFR